MSANLSSKEIVQVLSIKENEMLVEQKRLRTGDLLIRSAIGETVVLSNGVQVLIRPGYFNLSGTNEVTVERSKSGITTLIFANADELKFSDEGLISLRRGMLLFQITRKDGTESAVA